MSHENIRDHVKTYRNIFIALLILTGLTVGVSYIHFNLLWVGIFVGLLIASIKGYLVAANFMHLNNEKSTIYMSLVITVMFFIVLFFMPLVWHKDALKSPDNIPKANGNVLKEIDDHHNHGHH